MSMVLIAAIGYTIASAGRIMSLERSHRNFQVKIDEVARSYHVYHTADRSGVFTMSSEFDAVLELAAQMSRQARELADVYSDEKVARAKTFLEQHQQETERQQTLILHALRDIRKWSQQVELEESVVASQLSQLEDPLEATLPALGYSLGKDTAEIVPLPQKPAAE